MNVRTLMTISSYIENLVQVRSLVMMKSISSPRTIFPPCRGEKEKKKGSPTPAGFEPDMRPCAVSSEEFRRLNHDLYH